MTIAHVVGIITFISFLFYNRIFFEVCIKPFFCIEKCSPYSIRGGASVGDHRGKYIVLKRKLSITDNNRRYNS